MTKPMKLEPNTNRTRAPEPKPKGKKVDYKVPTTHGSQKGKFVGDPSAIHVHIVGDNTHIIVRGKRTEIKLKGAAALKTKTLKAARDELTKPGNSAVSGYKNCLAWIDAQ